MVRANLAPCRLRHARGVTNSSQRRPGLQPASEMNALAATDTISVSARIGPALPHRLYNREGAADDSRMPIARNWRWLLLVCLLVIGLGGTVFFTRTWRGDASTERTPATHSARKPDVTQPNGDRSNPAAQRSGAPDPVAQRTAAASASRAADAAAELAASAASSTH